MLMNDAWVKQEPHDRSVLFFLKIGTKITSFLFYVITAKFYNTVSNTSGLKYGKWVWKSAETGSKVGSRSEPEHVTAPEPESLVITDESLSSFTRSSDQSEAIRDQHQPIRSQYLGDLSQSVSSIQLISLSQSEASIWWSLSANQRPVSGDLSGPSEAGFWWSLWPIRMSSLDTSERSALLHPR